MAVVGKLSSLGSMFSKTQELKVIYEYLQSAITPDTPINQRIKSLSADHSNEYHLGDGIRAIEQSYMSGKKSFFESHIDFVDFQLVVEGMEYFYLSDISNMKEDYRKQDRDLIVYQSNLNCDLSKILLGAGDLAVFFPNDVHCGGVSVKSPTLVKKSVLKVPKELLKLKF